MAKEEKLKAAAEQSAEDAAELEAEEATNKNDPSRYTHEFNKTFEWMGKSYDTLSFDFSALTGKDSLAIEREVLTVSGKTVIMPEYTPEYLVGMLARSCTERNEAGKKVIGTDAFNSMPLGDFQRMTKAARRFLLRYGS